MTDDRQSLMACHGCGAIYQRRSLVSGEQAECSRCGIVLDKHSRLNASSWLALAISALIVFVIANAMPVASMTVQGATQQATLLDAVALTFGQGKTAVALMTGLSGFLVPLLQILALLWLLFPLANGRPPAGFQLIVRLLGWLLPWSMVPVFLLGAVVSVVKLAGMAAVEPGVGLLAFAVLTVLLTILGRLQPDALWRLAEEAGVVSDIAPVTQHDDSTHGTATVTMRQSACHTCGEVQAMPVEGTCRCRRCHATVSLRRPESLARTTALLLAAAVFYVPANLYPVMRTSTLLGDTDSTILGGVVLLWSMGSWDIALIVFVASVVIPLGKLLALAVLVFQAHRGAAVRLRQRTVMYAMVERIGQWSMLDVYVVILLAALANFPGLAQVSAGSGAAAFGLVVVLTMLAAMSYDPRIIWDNEPDDDCATANPSAIATDTMALQPESNT